MHLTFSVSLSVAGCLPVATSLFIKYSSLYPSVQLSVYPSALVLVRSRTVRCIRLWLRLLVHSCYVAHIASTQQNKRRAPKFLLQSHKVIHHMAEVRSHKAKVRHKVRPNITTICVPLFSISFIKHSKYWQQFLLIQVNHRTFC